MSKKLLEGLFTKPQKSKRPILNGVVNGGAMGRPPPSPQRQVKH